MELFHFLLLQNNKLKFIFAINFLNKTKLAK
jgi:hypothetical protein